MLWARSTSLLSNKREKNKVSWGRKRFEGCLIQTVIWTSSFPLYALVLVLDSQGLMESISVTLSDLSRKYKKSSGNLKESRNTRSTENKNPLGPLTFYREAGETCWDYSVALDVPCCKCDPSDCKMDRRKSCTDYCPAYLRALLCSLCSQCSSRRRATQAGCCSVLNAVESL